MATVCIVPCPFPLPFFFLVPDSLFPLWFLRFVFARSCFFLLLFTLHPFLFFSAFVFALFLCPFSFPSSFLNVFLCPCFSFFVTFFFFSFSVVPCVLAQPINKFLLSRVGRHVMLQKMMAKSCPAASIDTDGFLNRPQQSFLITYMS